MGFLDRRSDPAGGQPEPAASDPAQQPDGAAEADPLQLDRSTAPDRSRACRQSGRERLERMKQDIARGFFTSDLSVNEFLLVKEAGFEPLGLVLGSSIYHIGFQQANWNQNQEMQVLTQAMYHARELAMTRMEEEADQLGADGVVGVRLTIGRYDWGADLAEFIAVGTAVKHAGGELHRAPDGRPFTSDLSGQDFSTLLRAGYRPVGAGDGQLRLPRGAPGDDAVDAAGRAQHGDAELHAGALRRARAGDGAHAVGGRGGCSPAVWSACGSTRPRTAGART